MQLPFGTIIFSAILSLGNSVVYLRSRSLRGPRTWNSGVECIKNIASFYFTENRILRTKSISLVHMTNLTSPAREIDVSFAEIVNNLVEKEFFKESLIRIATDSDERAENFNENSFKPITPSDYYILITDSHEKIINLIKNKLKKSIVWSQRAKFLIIFNNSKVLATSGNLQNFVERFFKKLLDLFDITDVVYAFASGIVTYDIFSTRLYQRTVDGRCEKIIAKRLDSCHDGKIRGLAELQEQALETTTMTLNDCNLRICCQVSPPFVDEECETGIELALVRVIWDQMKFDPEIVCTNMSRGDIEDGVATDLLNELVERRCDLLIGSFFPDNDLEDFGQSVTYMEDSYTWYAPLAEYRAPWKSLLVIFLYSTWLLLIFSLIWAGSMWYVLGRFSHRENHHHKLYILCLLNAWQVLIGISTNNRPNHMPLRLLFISIALYGLNIATIYTSKLITVFTNPVFDDQIDTREKILISGLPFGGRAEYHDWFDNGDEIDKVVLKRFNISADFQPTTESLVRVREGKQILLANRMFVLSNNYNDLIFGFRDNVFSNPMEIITTKGFPLLLDFNNIISILKDNGITFKLYNDFMYNITILARMRTTNNEEIDTVLTVKHLQGPFIILLYGYILSIIVFCGELVRHRWFSK
uniref:Ionotropic glutamate receptor C-terminal domain-containing protein n=1 Tax=Phlebotomus papatasi TaxID=29031 RepID=A0A8W9BMM3_PHLPP